MNDSTKRIEPQGHLPRSFDDSGRPLLKADMPLWETPKYLQEDAFPIPKETAPAQLEKERPRPEGPRAGAAEMAKNISIGRAATRRAMTPALESRFNDPSPARKRVR